jgi:hypothetical protein
MDSLQIIAIMSGSAVVSRNFVQWMKVRKWVTTVYECMAASYITNFVIITSVSLGMYWYNGGHVTSILAKSVIGMVLSALYHDYNTNKPQIFISQTPPPAPTTDPSQSTE